MWNGQGEKPVPGLKVGYSTAPIAAPPSSGSGSGTGPQVIHYDPGVLGEAPVVAYMNGLLGGGSVYNDQWGSLGSYDPATKVALQGARYMNPANFAEVNANPVLAGYMRSLYNRAGRDWDMEGNVAMNNAPRGSATQYVVTR